MSQSPALSPAPLRLPFCSGGQSRLDSGRRGIKCVAQRKPRWDRVGLGQLGPARPCEEQGEHWATCPSQSREAGHLNSPAAGSPTSLISCFFIWVPELISSPAPVPTSLNLPSFPSRSASTEDHPQSPPAFGSMPAKDSLHWEGGSSPLHPDHTGVNPASATHLPV